MVIKKSFFKIWKTLAIASVCALLLNSTFSQSSWGMEGDNQGQIIKKKPATTPRKKQQIQEDAILRFLPAELWYNIFGLLDKKSAQNVLVVSKSWTQYLSSFVRNINPDNLKFKKDFIALNNHFPYVTKITMSQDQVQKGLSFISVLSNIKTLDLRKCRSIDDPSQWLSTLTNIQSLFLSNIRTEGAWQLFSLTNLQQLDLQVRSPQTIFEEFSIPKVIAFNFSSLFPNLTSLNLSGKKSNNSYVRRQVDSASLSALNRLTYLNLAGCRSGDDSVRDKESLFLNTSHLSSLTNLQSLDLFLCNIKELHPLSTLLHLKELNLGVNWHLSTKLCYLSSLSNLKKLNLEKCGIEEETISYLQKQLTNLQVLDNPVNIITPQFGGVPPLPPMGQGMLGVQQLGRGIIPMGAPPVQQMGMNVPPVGRGMVYLNLGGGIRVPIGRGAPLPMHMMGMGPRGGIPGGPPPMGRGGLPPQNGPRPPSRST